MTEVDVIYRMRESLEPLALAESIPALSAADLEHLESVQQRVEHNSDIQEFLELDREFHLLSYSGCTVEPLSSLIRRLWSSTQHYRWSFVAISGPGHMWIVNAEHRLLLDAIVRRDEVDAGNIARGHIRRTRIELARHPGIFRADA